MTLSNDNWQPGAELLAAYCDGELAGRPDLDALSRRVEDWLRRNPDARAAVTAHRRLDRLWEQTAPPEPGPDAWQHLEARLEHAALSRPSRALFRRFALGSRAAGILAVAASVCLLIWIGLNHRGTPEVAQPKPVPPAATVEVFPVATADEIAILHVEGADTPTLVVGAPPVQGALELAGPGEVVLSSVQPDAHDRMVPHIRFGGKQRPMVWAPVGAEEVDP
jgi:hypothetical protein